MGELHITVETVAFVLGSIAIVVPGAYMVGRFHQRLTSVEKSLESSLRRAEEIAQRIAAALEMLVEHIKNRRD